jgi:hypothetical protein
MRTRRKPGPTPTRPGGRTISRPGRPQIPVRPLAKPRIRGDHGGGLGDPRVTVHGLVHTGAVPAPNRLSSGAAAHDPGRWSPCRRAHHRNPQVLAPSPRIRPGPRIADRKHGATRPRFLLLAGGKAMATRRYTTRAHSACGSRCPRITLALVRIAGHGGVGAQRGLRPDQSARRLGPRSTSRSIPRARSLALAEYARRPQPADLPQREHPAPEARASMNVPAGRQDPRTPPGIPGRGRTPLLDHPQIRTPGRSPDRARCGRSRGSGQGRQGATESGCSIRPRRHFGKHAPGRADRGRRPRLRLRPSRPGALFNPTWARALLQAAELGFRSS